MNNLNHFLVSFDGFRADYLNEFLSNNPNSYLQKLFVEVGVKAKYMNPSFPSLTFPNHFTLVTGLYMESHGITGNSFFDPNYNQSVNLLRDSNAMDIKYWNGSEPIWETAKRQGLKTASFFWTGSEVWGKNPDIFMAYNNRISFESRCDEIVNWFAKFELDFATLYFNEPDHTGHEYGPNSNEYKAQVKKCTT
jgi:predicted AlkP superfamily pyrophosphatase or phosphodiesterase